LSSEDKIGFILETLKKRYGIRKRKRDPFRTLISTILSQRTRDEQTEKATKRLLEKYPNAEDLAYGDVEEIERRIKGVGFYREKAKKIKEVARVIHGVYGNRVPDDLEDLLKLPGVGRKTANCVLLYGYNISALPVDTHVHRVSNRIGLVRTDSPDETELELKKILPEELWSNINELFIDFGREICKPIGPKCPECFFNDFCEYALKK
jgi:DNA-(apurinic or apyrimidinic site) lyase (EC 4.2.99.18)/endonuclease III (EC 3.2.2.-)